jgi:hypothetical protein
MPKPALIKLLDRSEIAISWHGIRARGVGGLILMPVLLIVVHFLT